MPPEQPCVCVCVCVCACVCMCLGCIRYAHTCAVTVAGAARGGIAVDARGDARTTPQPDPRVSNPTTTVPCHGRYGAFNPSQPFASHAGKLPFKPWAIDQSYIGTLPHPFDFFLQLCDAGDVADEVKRDGTELETETEGLGGGQGGGQGGAGAKALPPHCAVVKRRRKVLRYITLAEADGYSVTHGHRGNGTKFFT